MIIIAFGNKAQNGKDTAGEAVVDFYKRKKLNVLRHGLIDRAPTVAIFKFAEELYHECCVSHGMTIKDPALLQRIGQARREENQNYWVDKLMVQLDHSPYDIAVITDIRYVNEAKAVKARGGWLINVSRINGDGTPFISPDRDPKHISEVALDGYNFDFYIRSKSSVLTGELAIATAEYIVGLS